MWIFKVSIKNVFKKRKKSKIVTFSKDDYTWHDAWIKCLDTSIYELSDNEVIASIESINDIVVKGARRDNE